MAGPRKAKLFAAVTSALGFGAVAAALALATRGQWRLLALLGAAVVVTELLQVNDDDSSVDPIGTHACSFSSAVHIGAVLIVGVWPAVLVAAFGVVVVDLVRGFKLRYVAFNASVFSLATLVGGCVFVALGGVAGRIELPREVLPLAALALVYGAVNTLLVNAIVAVEASRSLRAELPALFRAEPSLRAAEGGLGATFAFFVLSNPWKLIFLLPLVLAVYQAQARLAQLRGETTRALETFANVVDERDPYTYRHSARVSEYVRRLAEALELPAATVRRLSWAGRLHDVGKIAVDTRVLLKPGRLTEAEWSVMRRHPRLSARLLRRFRFAAEEARTVEFHHERFDGDGYYGVAASEQPLGAQFLVAADTYDAMTTDRPYRKGLSRDEALTEIESQAGRQIHPVIARAFVAMERGEDVGALLSPEERTEIRRLVTRRRPLSPALAAARTLEFLPLLAIATALLSYWLGGSLVAICAAVVSVLAFGFQQLERVRVLRITGSLRSLLAAARGRENAFAGVVGRLAATADVRWAGLVEWRDAELNGSLELEQRLAGDGPEVAALTSWLIREADSEDELVRSEGWELGRVGEQLALPLRRDAKTVGFLVLELGGRGSRRLERALVALAGDLSTSLRPDVRPETARPRLAAAR